MSILKQLKNVFINDGTINGSDIEYDSLVNIVKQMNFDLSFGELHPYCDTYTRSITIELKNVSHQFVNVKLEGRCIYGDINILDTNSGRMLNDMIQDGHKFKFLFRGLATPKTTTLHDIKLVAFDAYPVNEV